MKTAKEVLTDMVEVLNQGSDDSKNLWSVITALRGPDNGFESLKRLTTVRFRGALGFTEKLDVVVENDVPFGVFEFAPFGSYNQVYELRDALARQLSRDKDDIDFHFILHYCTGLRSLIDLGYLPDSKKATISTPEEEPTVPGWTKFLDPSKL